MEMAEQTQREETQLQDFTAVMIFDTVNLVCFSQV